MIGESAAVVSFSFDYVQLTKSGLCFVGPCFDVLAGRVKCIVGNVIRTCLGLSGFGSAALEGDVSLVGDQVKGVEPVEIRSSRLYSSGGRLSVLKGRLPLFPLLASSSRFLQQYMQSQLYI